METVKPRRKVVRPRWQLEATPYGCEANTEIHRCHFPPPPPYRFNVSQRLPFPPFWAPAALDRPWGQPTKARAGLETGLRRSSLIIARSMRIHPPCKRCPGIQASRNSPLDKSLYNLALGWFLMEVVTRTSRHSKWRLLRQSTEVSAIEQA